MKEHLNVRIELLFPIPIVFIDLNRELTEVEKNTINEYKNNVKRNQGNSSSKNTYVLNDERLANLKQFFTNETYNYFKNFYNPENEIEFYITQSWLNMTNTNEFHHAHTHSNSVMSGVFYLEVDEDMDSITFHNSKDSFNFYIPSNNWFMYFAKTWSFKIKKNTLILFPSTLMHSVDNVQADKQRISLAYNTFIKGTLGSYDSLSELKL